MIIQKRIKFQNEKEKKQKRSKAKAKDLPVEDNKDEDLFGF